MDIGILLGRPARFRDLLLQPLVTQGARAALLYRFSSWLLRAGLKRPAWLARRFNGWLHGCVIHEASRIGGGLALPHPLGVHIGKRTCIGENVWIFQNAILGPRPTGNDDPEPRIGSHVVIGPAAGIYGPVEIGNFVTIGPGAILHRDVPDGSTVYPPEPRTVAGTYAGYRSPWWMEVRKKYEEKEKAHAR